MVDIPRRRWKTPAPSRRPSNSRGVMVSAVVILAVAVLVSSAALLPPRPAQEKSPVRSQAPMTPFYLVGYTYDSTGAKLGGVAVHVHNLNTNAWNNVTVSDPITAYYSLDIMNNLTGMVAGGQVINITCMQTTLIGYNQSALPAVLASYYQMDCHLHATVIPELSSLVFPIVGFLGMLSVVSAVKRRKK